MSKMFKTNKFRSVSRIWHSGIMCLIMSPTKRANYLKKHNVFQHIGDHCMVMFRKIPLYPHLISFGNNVRIASNVTFITHDAIHNMTNYMSSCDHKLEEKKGNITIKDNVFVGANSTILYDVEIGPDVIIGACSLVNKSVANGVYAGVPARYICSVEEFLEKRKQTSDQ